MNIKLYETKNTFFGHSSRISSDPQILCGQWLPWKNDKEYSLRPKVHEITLAWKLKRNGEDILLIRIVLFAWLGLFPSWNSTFIPMSLRARLRCGKERRLIVKQKQALVCRARGQSATGNDSRQAYCSRDAASTVLDRAIMPNAIQYHPSPLRCIWKAEQWNLKRCKRFGISDTPECKWLDTRICSENDFEVSFKILSSDKFFSILEWFSLILFNHFEIPCREMNCLSSVSQNRQEQKLHLLYCD